MLYSFRKSGKILSALLDVEKLFPTGSMGETIHEAAGYIQGTYDGKKITEKALTIIETEYPTRRMVSAHRLMLKAEQIGGSCEASIRILLKDRDMWEKETLSYRRHCQMQKRNITAAIILSASLCLMTPPALSDFPAADQRNRTTDIPDYYNADAVSSHGDLSIYRNLFYKGLAVR